MKGASSGAIFTGNECMACHHGGTIVIAGAHARVGRAHTDVCALRQVGVFARVWDSRWKCLPNVRDRGLI